MEIFTIKYLVYKTKEICKMGAKKNTEKTYELKYTGWLLENDSPIYLHYGIGNWSEISENKMRKLKSCYKTEITIPADVASVGFCFRDSNGNWDNNSGNDYWYTETIGETYSNVEVSISEKEPVTAKKCSTVKAITAKKAVKSEK